MLYSQAMKCDEKALQCYKNAGEKIKEYEAKSNKCEDMINKCNMKLNQCNHKDKKCNDIMPKYVKMDKCKHSCNKNYQEYNFGCHCDNKKVNKPKSNMNDDIIYIDNEYLYMNDCPTYVSPMYDMYQMQCMGDFAHKYPSLDMPYMNGYMNQYQDLNDMWMNYYMMMQNMMDKRDFY